MVRAVLAAVLFVLPVLASDLLDGVRALLGDRAYMQNQAKIEQIFANESRFIDGNANLNYAKICPILRSNGLLNLSYKTPINVDISFVSGSSKALVMQIIKDSLNDLGYGYIQTKSLSLSKTKVDWQITINTQFVPDPSALYSELLKYNSHITNIQKNGDMSYIYEIDAGRARLPAKSVQRGEWVSLSKPFEPYFLDVYGGAGAEIKSRSNDAWIALVKVFDRDLNLIFQIRSQTTQKSLSLKLPENAYYMVIDDVFSLENIRHGIDILIKTE